MTVVLDPVRAPQVVIIGAGPVGLTLAIELARFGVAVRIVDRTTERSDKSKALIVWSRTLELLERAGCSDAFVDAGLQVAAATVTSGANEIGRMDFGAIDSAYPYALMLPQPTTERLLESRLAALGVRVERGTTLTRFEQQEHGVVVSLRNADGVDDWVEALWMVGCDGAHSKVRELLDIPFEGKTLESTWAIADVRFAGTRASETEFSIHWHADGLFAIFPLAPGRHRIVASTNRSSAADTTAAPTVALMQSIVDTRGPGGLTIEDCTWRSTFRIDERMVADYRSQRVFLAGDAAHVHSPAGGQGMNTGMQDAFNLAWKLALVCLGRANGPALLDSYSVERVPVGEKVLADASRLTRMAMLAHPMAQGVRNFVAKRLLRIDRIRDALRDSIAEVSIAYPHSPLNSKAPKGFKGLLPGFRVVATRPIPVGFPALPTFVLHAGFGESAARLVREFSGLLDPVVRPPLCVDGMWLVRPDGYVACVAVGGDFETFACYLRAIRAEDNHTQTAVPRELAFHG